MGYQQGGMDGGERKRRNKRKAEDEDGGAGDAAEHLLGQAPGMQMQGMPGMGMQMQGMPGMQGMQMQGMPMSIPGIEPGNALSILGTLAGGGGLPGLGGLPGHHDQGMPPPMPQPTHVSPFAIIESGADPAEAVRRAAADAAAQGIYIPPPYKGRKKRPAATNDVYASVAAIANPILENHAQNREDMQAAVAAANGMQGGDMNSEYSVHPDVAAAIVASAGLPYPVPYHLLKPRKKHAHGDLICLGGHTRKRLLPENMSAKQALELHRNHYFIYVTEQDARGESVFPADKPVFVTYVTKESPLYLQPIALNSRPAPWNGDVEPMNMCGLPGTIWKCGHPGYRARLEIRNLWIHYKHNLMFKNYIDTANPSLTEALKYVREKRSTGELVRGRYEEDEEKKVVMLNRVKKFKGNELLIAKKRELENRRKHDPYHGKKKRRIYDDAGNYLHYANIPAMGPIASLPPAQSASELVTRINGILQSVAQSAASGSGAADETQAASALVATLQVLHSHGELIPRFIKPVSDLMQAALAAQQQAAQGTGVPVGVAGGLGSQPTGQSLQDAQTQQLPGGMLGGETQTQMA